ncbi:MAG: SDR family oxidoreductase [Candidatus Sumerlaeia bacterium]|nr:SDR family oxidoreductase [Candidatus Sumerlaeia bacterium]
MSKPLEGRIAWISGASRGIGRSIALKAVRAGAIVCAGSRDQESLAQLRDIAATEGHTIHPIELDVASHESVEKFAKHAVDLAGPPSILINNAGTGLFRDLDAMEISDFDRQIDVNLKGPWYLARAAVPHMKRLGGGRIINISSIAGTVSFQRGSAYCASKAGLHAMSEALMLELRQHGIGVTVIAPGSVETGFHRDALPSAHHNDQSWMLTPETIADACLHILTTPDIALVSKYEIRPLKPGK